MKKTSKESNKTLHIVLIIGAVAVAGLVGYVVLFGNFVPPISQTGLAMNSCKERIQQYALEHDKLPAKLSDTKEIAGTFNSNIDGWGNDIIYSADANGVVTLTSYGKDKKPGGTGDNTDITGIFKSREINGEWANQNVGWTKEPFSELRKQRRR